MSEGRTLKWSNSLEGFATGKAINHSVITEFQWNLHAGNAEEYREIIGPSLSVSRYFSGENRIYK